MTTPLPSALRRLRIGYESTFGTAASNMKDLAIVDAASKGLLRGSTTETAPNKDAGRYLHDEHAVILLRKAKSPFEFQVYLKALAARVATGTSPVASTHASALSHQVLFAHLFGAEAAPAEGSLVVSHTSDTVTVTTGEGSHYPIGTMIAAASDVADGFEIRQVIARSTDALTVDRAWSGTLTDTTGALFGGYTYYRPELHRSSITIEDALVETGTPTNQVRARGGYGSMEFALEIGQPATCTIKGLTTTHTDPGDLSISMIDTADDMGDPFAWFPKCYLNTAASAGSASSTAAPTVLDPLAVKIMVPAKWVEIPSGNGVEGVSQVVNLAGIEDGAVMAEVEFLYDVAYWADFTAQTIKSFTTWTQRSSGASARFVGFHLPYCRVRGEPVRSVKNGLEIVTIKLAASMNRVITSHPTPGSTGAQSLSPVQFFLL